MVPMTLNSALVIENYNAKIRPAKICPIALACMRAHSRADHRKLITTRKFVPRKSAPNVPLLGLRKRQRQAEMIFCQLGANVLAFKTYEVMLSVCFCISIRLSHLDLFLNFSINDLHVCNSLNDIKLF